MNKTHAQLAADKRHKKLSLATNRKPPTNRVNIAIEPASRIVKPYPLWSISR